MELIILIAVVVAVLGYFLWRDRKYEESGDHPLDGATKQNEVPYKVEPPVLTTKVDGIGHETVEVAATVQEPAKKPKKPKKPAQPKRLQLKLPNQPILKPSLKRLPRSN